MSEEVTSSPTPEATPAPEATPEAAPQNAPQEAFDPSSIPDADDFVPTKWQRYEDEPEAETEGEPEAEVVAEPEVEAEPEPEKTAENLITVKVNGKEQQVPIEQLVDRYQRGEGANEKFAEAAAIRDQAASIIKTLQSNPLAVLRHPALGIPKEQLRKMMEGALYEEISYEKMSPEQREALDNKRRLEAMEQEKKVNAETQERQKMAELRKHYSETFHKQIVDALDTSKMPKTAYTAKRMAYYMHQVLGAARKKGIQGDVPMPMDKITELVKKDYETDISHLLGAMPDDNLVTVLGKDTLKRIRQQEVAKLKKIGRTPEKQGEPITDKPRKKKTMTMAQWKEQNRRTMYGSE